MMTSLLTLSALAATVDGRLADPVHPVRQTVRLNLDPATEKYEGLVEITLQVDVKVSSFTLHAEDLEIQWAAMGAKKLKPATFEADGPFLTVTPAKPLKPGLTTLEIAFAGTLGTSSAGMFSATEGEHTYIVTQFEADDARTAFPCFDEPSYKIPWTVELTTPSDLVTLGNMPVEEEIKNGDVRTLRFQTSPAMPSYLVALAVGPFDSVVVEGASVPITLYTPAGKANQTAELADQFPRHLDYLTAWFGRELPYPKLDAVVAPEFPYGGMENPGLVVLRDNVLLDPKTTTPGQRSRVAEVVGHEVAHMWFGNLVTLAWWDDLWLNESFASWMGLKSRAAVFPGQPGEFSRVARSYRAIGADGSGSMRPLRTPVDPSNVFESANFLAYPKGQAILGATERWLGPEVFQRGLRKYMSDHAFGNARAADLFQALSDESGEDVGHILTPYLDEPGAPLLTFTATETGWKVRQQRYIAIGSDIDDDTIWPVPIVFRTANGEGRYLLDGLEGQFEADPSEWLLPVADGVGYFAWTFEDPAHLRALAASADQLTTPEQLALVGNLGALTTGGELEVAQRLELHQAMIDEVDAPTREWIVEILDSMESIVPPELDDAYSRYGTEVLGPLFAELGTEPVLGESDHVASLRNTVIQWLGKYGQNAEVEAFRAAQTEALLADPASADLDAASDALLAHAKGQDLAFQKSMLARAEAEANPRLRSVFVQAFASVDDPNARDRAILWAMEEERSLDDMFTVVFTLFEDDDKYGDIALDWAIDNHEVILPKVPPQFRAQLIGMGRGCDLARFERAKAFYLDPQRLEPGVERIAAEIEESVRTCITRRETYGESLAETLEPYTKPRR